MNDLLLIADHAHDGLAVTDPKGHVVYSNAAYLVLTGAASPQALSTSVFFEKLLESKENCRTK